MKKKISLLKSYSIWFTGYPSSGKTTLANFIQKEFQKKYKIPVIVLDGDKIRRLINSTKDYTFKKRIHTVNFYINLSKVLLKSKLLLVVSANHAFKQQRKIVSSSLGKKYCEIWISTPLSVCKKRDVKGLFSRAKKGKVTNLVGYDLKFDKPDRYDLKINTKDLDIYESYKRIEKTLLKKKVISYDK